VGLLVAQVNPSVMLYIFPNVSVRLGAEDAEHRTRAVGQSARVTHNMTKPHPRLTARA
jgi:hypothetical protein